MKRSLSALFALVAAITAAVPVAHAGEQLLPAGSLVQCTISEPKLSSKSEQIGDPVLCTLSHSERYGRATVPFGSYLVGRFEEYKDPGHFVGKGWMELKFDRMVIEPDTSIPVEAKIVDVPGYSVDRVGRIQGKGHPVRDTVEWSIPILWPLDLLNLPRRGPRPTLKGETRLTLKIMDDLGIPSNPGFRQDGSGLYHRQPTAYTPPAPAPVAPAPVREIAYPQPVPIMPFASAPAASAPFVEYAVPPPVVLAPVRIMRRGVYYRSIAR